MNIKYRQSCRICGNPYLKEVIDLGYQYFQGSFEKEGLPAPTTRKTPNVVVRCDTSKSENACGLIQTKHSVPPLILYANYWYESGISNTMKTHLKSIVDKCLDITKIKSGTVLDIASNDNTLLRCYPPSFKRIGVDPSNITAKQKDTDIQVINDLFPTSKLNESHFIDIISSIACYYDVDDPKAFAMEIKRLLSPNGIWVFEVAYWPSMLKNLAYDSIVNEHIIHYHLAPLDIMFDSLGLKVFDARITDTNGGSIMCFVCKKENFSYDSLDGKKRLSDIRMQEFNDALDEDSTYDIFRSKVKLHKEELVLLIKNLVKQGKKIHIYGASTKLNTILGYCEIGADLIPFAAERSPAKIGGKTLGGIQLISEEQSKAMHPDYYLVGPYHFKREILEREKETIKSGIKFIFPLPILEIV